MRFPAALDAVIAADSAKVEALDNRKGRRRTQRATFFSCPAAEELQQAKFQRLDPTVP